MPHPYWPTRSGATTRTGEGGQRGRDGVAPRIGSEGGDPRPSWHSYFLGIARAAAARSDCTRSQVGAVVVKGHRVRSTGYNGAPAGMAGCGTCPRSQSAVQPLTGDYDSPGSAGACVAVHAEVNAVLYADRADVVGSTVYVTREPCAACTKTCRAAGVEALVWPSPAPTGLRLPDQPAIVYLDLRVDCGGKR